MKIDFTKISVEIDFEGTQSTFNVAKKLGNAMKYESSVMMDIGFEDLARDIYYSNGAVDIPERYVSPIVQVVRETNFIAAVKRGILELLNT
jgi:hypothetical protein